MGMVVNSGCKKTRNTGTRASVRKKFQCTPYSVTCSFIHQFISTVGEKRIKQSQPTGYWVPLTSNTRTSPSARTGAHFKITDAISDVRGGLDCNGVLRSGMADTMP